MPDNRSPVAAYRFGPFRLNVTSRLLERDGKRVQVTPKVVDTLLVLVENAQQVVSKEALMKAVWPDVNVVESGLTRNISALRRVLEEESGEGSFLETIPRRGYRFVAEVVVEVEAAAAAEPLVSPPTADDAATAALIAPQAERKPRSLPGGWMVAIGAVSALAVVAWYVSGSRGGSAALVEPEVRIGEHFLYKSAPEETRRAVEQFEGAVAANPESAAAHAGLAVALVHLSGLGVQALSEVGPRAEKAARRAIQLDGRSGAAHFALGSMLQLQHWDFAGAEAAFRRSLELSPDSVPSRMGYARLKIAMGELERARVLVEEALRIDPASPLLGAEYCRVFYFQQRFRRSEAECRKVLDREKGFGLARYYLALNLAFLGQLDEAEREFRQSGLMPGVVAADLAWLSRMRGDSGPAMAVLEERRQLARDGKVDASAKILPAVTLELWDEAFEGLEVGVKLRAIELMTVMVDPRLAGLRRDPRFAAVLRRAGFPIGKNLN